MSNIGNIQEGKDHQTQVQEQMNMLDHFVGELIDVINRLDIQLAPILTNLPPPSPATEDAVAELVPLADMLRKSNDCIKAAITQINDTKHRLQL